MQWWACLLIAVIMWFGLAVARRYHKRRAQISITIPVKGYPSFQLTPDDTSPEDLSLLALCYGSKIRWLLLNEPELVGDIFQDLCTEAIDFWSAPGSDLIDRMPSARRLREDESIPHAIPSGERFVVTLYRTDYHNLRNKAWVTTTIPRPGLAANLPWSFLLVLNSIFVLLQPSVRETLGRAIGEWYGCAFGQSRLKNSLSSLNSLFEASLESLLHAKTKEIRE